MTPSPSSSSPASLLKVAGASPLSVAVPTAHATESNLNSTPSAVVSITVVEPVGTMIRLLDAEVLPSSTVTVGVSISPLLSVILKSNGASAETSLSVVLIIFTNAVLSFVNSQTSTSHGSRTIFRLPPSDRVASLLKVAGSSPLSLAVPIPHSTESNLNRTPSAVVSVIDVEPVGTMIRSDIIVLVPSTTVSCGVGSVPPF